VVRVIVPKNSRIDAAGALHHVMARGVERGMVLRNNGDRDQFLERLGETLKHVNAIWCACLVRKLWVPKSSLWRRVGISIPSMSESVNRGRRIAQIRGPLLLET
jgi:hypothetical protein